MVTSVRTCAVIPLAFYVNVNGTGDISILCYSSVLVFMRILRSQIRLSHYRREDQKHEQNFKASSPECRLYN